MVWIDKVLKRGDREERNKQQLYENTKGFWPYEITLFH